MQNFSVSPYFMMSSLWNNRNLIRIFIIREVAGRYRGSFLGLIWSFVNPLLMLAVYTFVFSVVFQARWGIQESGNRYEFALVLFSGLIVFNLFAECISRAPSLIINNANYVKKAVFPLEILPWVVLGSALFHTGISLGVLLIALLLTTGISWSVLLWPLVIFPLTLLIMGFSWILASVGVFVRDVGQFIGMIVTVMLFMSPIFYPLSALPETISRFIILNPLTLIIEHTRSLIVWGEIPSFRSLLCYYLVAACIAWVGFFWFQKTRKGFADVL